MSGCPGIADTAFLSTTLSYVDCQARTIGEQGYYALAAGSTVGALLGGALTLFIALFGYRLLLGDTPDLREIVVSVIKVGTVLMLATSWPAFRTLAYDVAFHAPGEIASNIAASSGLSAGADLGGQLQAIDDDLVELGVLGTGQPLAVAGPPTQDTVLDQMRNQAQVPAQRLQARWDPARDFSLLGTARTVFLTSTIASFAAPRLVAGLILGLGPLFALFLLFHGTRTLLEGWIRVLVGAAVGAFAVSIMLAVEVDMIAPWLLSVMADRYQNIATPAVPVELLVISLVFGLVMLAVLVGAARVASAFRFAPIAERLRFDPSRTLSTFQTNRSTSQSTGSVVPERSRALAIADAVATAQRSETSSGQRTISVRESNRSGPGNRANDPMPIVRLGQSYRSRNYGRVSARARRRDLAS